jgi:hypothetical protein
MRSASSRTGISVALMLLGAVTGCADSGKSREHGDAIGTNAMSFEEFEACTYREPATGVYIVSGDRPIPNREALRTFFDRYMRQGALTLHVDGDVEAKWDDTQKLQLTHRVSTGFAERYADVAAAMQAAADDWEASANIDFVHLSAEDASCGDGVVAGVEACDPPDGVTCDANCQIIYYPRESSCNNEVDDDSDGLFDCQDPDCQALGACTPGATPTGGACAAATDCSADAGDPFCISEPLFGWTGGYCSEYCDSANGCAGDSVCLLITTTTGQCFDGCVWDSDCRAGYSCQYADIDGRDRICYPEPEYCGNGVDDDNNGAVDCADGACFDYPRCAVCGNGVATGNESCDPPDGVTCDANCQVIYPPESSCNDLADDDFDGLYDCQDPDCQALGACTPGATPVGGACAAATDCSADAGDPFCFSEPLFGWAGGIARSTATRPMAARATPSACCSRIPPATASTGA